MSDSMIERMARALCVADSFNPDELVKVPLEPQRAIVMQMRASVPNRARWKSYANHARAVLTAMREPTEAMKQVAPSSGQALYPEDFWQPMIEAALAEEE